MFHLILRHCKSTTPYEGPVHTRQTFFQHELHEPTVNGFADTLLIVWGGKIEARRGLAIRPMQITAQK